MTREELAGKTKPQLTEIAKTLGVKGVSKFTRGDLIEHILLLDPPFSANPEQETEIYQHLECTLKGNSPLYTPPPLPEHLTGVAVLEKEEDQGLQTYNDTQIVLMVRDPYWLYSYWSINQETRNFISNSIKKWNEITLVLRVYDITNCNFDGSNSNYFFDININQDAANWYIHVGGPNRTFCVDLGFIQENGNFYTIARSNIVATPRDNISEVIDEEWMIIEEDFQKLYQISSSGLGNSSAQMVESLIKRLEKEMGSQAISSMSSPGKSLPRERKFWFVLNTELIVYGATEPDATVKLHGETIPLRPDGTFTLRFALPDGSLNIPVEAQSNDKLETITITPLVEKQTSYQTQP